MKHISNKFLARINIRMADIIAKETAFRDCRLQMERRNGRWGTEYVQSIRAEAFEAKTGFGFDPRY